MGDDYIGSELEVFKEAVVWKRYWSSKLVPFVGENVVEVGAGLGSNTAFLNDGTAKSWVCLEPDRKMAESIREAAATSTLPRNVVVDCGTLTNFTSTIRPDTIVYIDVLEHILDDRAEIELAAWHLMPGGHLIVLAPAHQFLFSPFDSAIGHFRRYSQASLEALGCANLTRKRSFYLDSVGLAASLTNKLFLKASRPTSAQVRLWDRVLVPLSMIFDKITAGRLGKTVVVVWSRQLE